MITLNEIAYNIRNLAYGGINSIENNIDIRQIKHWIHYHRAKLIADNIDKGITNDQSLYQTFQLTLRQSTTGDAANYYEAYDLWQKDPGNNTAPNITGAFLLNHPKTTAGLLTGSFLALSSMTRGTSSQQRWTDSSTKNQYGLEIKSHQLRGDFRNVGYHAFWCPRSLQLKNNEGIKNIRLKREPCFPDDTATDNTDESLQGHGMTKIALYREENTNQWNQHNKFTNHGGAPYYHQSTTIHQREDNQSENHIVLRNLQVSPNYHGGLKTPAHKKVFWRYDADAEMILEDPTKIDMMHGTYYLPTNKWDDAKNPYPIPMEYVSDLIQRVVQVEMRTALQTQPDLVGDGMDDIIKSKIKDGTQVQR